MFDFAQLHLGQYDHSQAVPIHEEYREHQDESCEITDGEEVLWHEE
jgi:hypothetical protein